MAVIVELTGDEAALLRSIDKVIQKQVEFERKLRDTETQGDAAGFALQGALDKVHQESDKALNGLLRELKQIGPEGSTAAAALRSHLREAGKAGHRSFDEVLAQIRLIDPEAAEAAEKAGRSLESAAGTTAAAWRQQIEILRGLGPAGAKAADQIERDLRTAAAEATDGMDNVLSKLKMLNPAAAESADRIRQELAEAAHYSEREFGQVLDELRSMGPKGQQAAAQIRKHLVDAGKIAEKSMGGIASKLEELDPESAKAAREIIANLEDVGEKGTGVFENFHLAAVAKIGLVALSFDKIFDAMRLVGDALERQRQLTENARMSHMDLAGVQQEALKNLANFARPDQLRVLDEIIPAVQAEERFPSQKALTIAASSLASTGAESPEQLEDFLREAAKVTRLTPDTVDEYALGAMRVSKATGLTARESMNLLFLGGANSQLTSPEDVATTLPNALNAGFQTSKITDENRAEATAQTAGFFGVTTAFGSDQTGDSSRTNTGKLLGFIEKLTVDLPNDPGLPLQRLQVIQQDPELKAQFLKELPVEQAFLPSFRKLADPGSDAYALLTSTIPNIKGGTEAVDQFEANLANGTRAMTIALMESTNQARTEQSQLTSATGAGNALLAQVRKATAEAVLQNQGTADFVVEEVMRNTLGWFTDAWQIDKGALPGTTAAEESVSAIRTLGAMRGNVTDPAKRQNLGLAMQGIVSGIVASAQDFTQSDAQSALQMINTPGEFRDSPETLRLLKEMADALNTLVRAGQDNAAPEAHAEPNRPAMITPALSGMTP